MMTSLQTNFLEDEEEEKRTNCFNDDKCDTILLLDVGFPVINLTKHGVCLPCFGDWKDQESLLSNSPRV